MPDFPCVGLTQAFYSPCPLLLSAVNNHWIIFSWFSLCWLNSPCRLSLNVVNNHWEIITWFSWCCLTQGPLLASIIYCWMPITNYSKSIFWCSLFTDSRPLFLLFMLNARQSLFDVPCAGLTHSFWLTSIDYCFFFS